MELKVFKNTIAAYGGRWETRLELPVETEILIPDYLPAVFKIVKCFIEPVVLQNRVASGRWQTEGYLRCTVYYQSEEAGCRLYRTEQKFAFEKTAELPAGQYAEGPARVWGEPEYCNCRAISEHRIDLRGAYILCGSVMALKECELLTGLAECGIEQRTNTLTGTVLIAAEEKTITSETAIPLPGAGEAILDITGIFAGEHCAVQTRQMNCSGTLQMQVCYQPEGEEELSVRQKEIPVQQTVDLAQAEEGDGCVFWGEVLACTLAVAEENQDPVLTVTWKLHLEIWRDVSYMTVADAYSTRYETQTVQTDCKLLQKTADLTRRLPIVIEDDLPSPEAVVKGCFVTLGAAVPLPTDKEAGGQQFRLQGKGIAHVFCADDRGELTCYDKAFVWQPEGVWNGTTAEAYPCIHAALNRVSSGKSGAKLRVEIEIDLTGTLLQANSHPAVSQVEVGEAYENTTDGPTLYLYYAKEGERVFDIAKRYHARAKDLAAANHLDPGGFPVQDLTTASACLLIPSAL